MHLSRSRQIAYVAMALFIVSCRSSSGPPRRHAPPTLAGDSAAPPRSRLEITEQPSVLRSPSRSTQPAWQTAPPGNSSSPNENGPRSAITPASAPFAKAPRRETVIRATAPIESEPPSPPTRPASEAEKLRELYQQAVARYEGITDYVARFRRREMVNGKQQPEDLLLMRVRKNPFSVYFKWLDGTASEGREILFVKGHYNNQMQVKTGRADLVAGMRITVDPHSPRATANSRRTIEEAGIGNMVERFSAVLAGHESGARTFGTLRYLGPHQRRESNVPMECVIQQVPPAVEKHLPRGGQRYWFFNADLQAKEFALPTLIVTLDESRREVEYYCHDHFNTNVCHPKDFDADAIWSGNGPARR